MSLMLMLQTKKRKLAKSVRKLPDNVDITHLKNKTIFTLMVNYKELIKCKKKV